MSKEALPEVVEKDAEIVPSKGVELNQNKFDAILKFAEQADRNGRALDTVRQFSLKRALPGDWVRHGDNVNLTGPGAERVLSALGLLGISASFTNWRYWKDTGTDKNGDWFIWWYEADVEVGGLRFEKVQGRAGSRDKFFGYEKGAWKDLSEVKEADIRMAARRGVIKDGVKLALGLRSIPAEAAAGLGLDVAKIKKVEYGGRGETKVDAPAAGTPVFITDVKAFRGTNKKTGKDFIRYEVYDDKGAKYSTFDEKLANEARDIKESGRKVVLAYDVSKFGNDLKAISEAPVAEAAGEAEAAE